MTADIRIFKPRKSKRLKTPSDRLSKRELAAKFTRISKSQAKAKRNVIQVWFGCEFQGKKARKL